MKQKIISEWLWAYDWWLAWSYDDQIDKMFHRVADEEALEIIQPVSYWPVYFRTKDNYYRNLTVITEEEFITNKELWEK